MNRTIFAALTASAAFGSAGCGDASTENEAEQSKTPAATVRPSTSEPAGVTRDEYVAALQAKCPDIKSHTARANELDKEARASGNPGVASDKYVQVGREYDAAADVIAAIAPATDDDVPAKLVAAFRTTARVARDISAAFAKADGSRVNQINLELQRSQTSIAAYLEGYGVSCDAR